MQDAISDTKKYGPGLQVPNGFAKYGELLLPFCVIDDVCEKMGVSGFAKDKPLDDKSDPLADRNGPRWKKNNAEDPYQWKEPLEDFAGPTLRIIKQQDIESHIDILEAQPKDDNHEKAVALLRSLVSRGELRKLHCRPVKWKTELKLLEARFPNFSEVIQHVRAACALSERGQLSTITLDNLILCGPPGVGKSYFAEFLAEFLRGKLAEGGTLTIRMADQQSNSAIAGSDSFWANSKPSLILEELLFKEYGNPVVILDELDKTSSDQRYDPLSPLYTLWQRSSAEKWKDLCFPWLPIDASKITWISTCNSIHTLPAPILSRARVFHIKAPSEEEAISIAETIAWESLQEYLPDDPMEFSDGAIKALSRLSPRQQRTAIKAALGKVALRNADLVRVTDILTEPASTRIGFL